MEKFLNYKRQYCCGVCGCIFLADVLLANKTGCPECGNTNKDGIIYATDSMSYAYNYDFIVEQLKLNNKKIHHYEDKEI